MVDKTYIEQVDQMYPDLKDTDIIEECAILEGRKGEQQLTICHEIDKIKLCYYSDKIRDIKENFTKVKQMFEMLSSDVEDFLDLLKSNSKLNVKYESKEVRRSMVHLLSSAKLFIEYSIVQCKKYSNQDNSLEDKFKQISSKQFDDNFSHRFCLYLRNFTQHVGLPISCVKQSVVNGIEKKQYLIDIDYLLNSSFKWRKLKLELLERRKINKYIECLFSIETKAIKYHLKSIGIEKCVLGVSGGIDSTVALLFLIGCFKTEKDRKNIYAFSLPCFGTTEKTKQNALSLCNLLGCNIEEIDITNSVLQHFRDIGQDSNNYDVTFENAQARERSQVLMDKANMLGAIFIGSSDISEIALGFSTYAGDHMSMYNILGSIPKTVLRLFLEYAIKNPKFFVIKKEDESSFKAIITSVLETPISPELLPHKDGNIVQKTESLLGSYELHDFFIYHIFQNHYSLKKVLYLAIKAFGYTYSEKVIVEQLKLFYKRFFANQFKRNCAPECPNVTGFSFANWELPSNIPYSLYLREFKEIEKYIHT